MSNFDVPRKIPFTLKLRLFLFHKPITQIGISFWFFSGIIFLFFFKLIDFSFFFIDENSPSTHGVILDVSRTSLKVGNHNIYKYKFSYKPLNSNLVYINTSYADNSSIQIGDMVNVIYSMRNPQIAKIVGMDYKPIPILLSFFLIAFPFLIGLILLVFSIPNFNRTLHIIQYGKPGEAQFISMTSTNIKINGKRMMKLIFRFKTKKGEYEFTYKTHHPEIYTNQQKKIPILFDPDNPHHVLLIDELPKGIRSII